MRPAATIALKRLRHLCDRAAGGLY